MPILGHSIIGLAMAGALSPAHSHTPRPRLWYGSLVALAYLPDVLYQLAAGLSLGPLRHLSHSVPFALAVSPAIGYALGRLWRMRFVRSWAITLIAILAHIGLDLCTGSDRRLWWPLSGDVVGWSGGFVLSMGQELIVFGLPCLAVVLFIRYRHRERRQQIAPDTALPSSFSPFLRVCDTVIVVLFIVMATGTQYLRDEREHSFNRIHHLLRTHQYAQAVELLPAVERWPYVGRPGRIDYVKAEAYRGIGDRAQAEKHYLAAYAADPDYFWCVADLATFYADSAEPIASRTARVQPYAERLRREFPKHPDLPGVLKKLDRQTLMAASNPADPPPATARGSN